MSKKRVISLLPAATEMVCAFEAADMLVGRSHECDYPPEIKSLTVCTASKVDGKASGTDIHREVGELLKAENSPARSLYQLDAAKMKELRPDVIITQGQCDVCAVSLREVEEMVNSWPGERPEIVSLAPNRLADIWDDMRRVAVALGIEEPGRAVIKGLKNRVVSIIEKTCVLTKRPSVACIEWIEPMMAAGNWVPELVELAGGKNALGEAGKHSAWMDWEALRKADPEIIIVMPCGFDIAQTRAEMPALTRHPDWPKLSAVKKNRVCLADGSQYFNRPGPRIVDSIEMLADILHPEIFQYGHKGCERYL